LLLASACGTAEPATPRTQTALQSPAPAVASQDVLAIVNGKEVTLADLQEMIGDRVGQMDFQYRSERHQVIETAMRRYVRDQLLEAAAAARGITADALLEEIIGDKTDVGEDDVRMFYLQNQAQMQGRTYEAMASQIRDYLENQIRETALEEFAEEAAAESDIEYVLGPFRVELDIAGAPFTGPADAPITMVEFSDFECPYCQSFGPTVEQVKATYPDDVKVVFLQFPLRQIHPNAQKSGEASLCAFEQDKFWEAHDLYFAERSSLTVPDLKEKAGRLGLDTEAFATCLDSGKYADRVQAEMDAGAAVGVTGTPAVFINGRPLPGGAVPFEMVAELIDDELERLGR
jgi:predicted DsbA family dithiol-disulfide isomerase